MFPVIILAIENEDDREFMMQLYTQYRALLYSEIYKIVQNEWDADDVLQNVIEKLIDRLSKLREMEHKGMVNYMITTAKHTAYNFCRDKRIIQPLDDEENISNDEPALEDGLIMRENLFCLSQIWGQLDEKTRYLLRSKYVLRKSGKEIAQELDMSPDNVRMAIVRARRKAYKAMLQRQSTS